MSDFDDRLVHAAVPELDDDDVRESELVVESLDDLGGEETTVVELAFGQRSWRFGHVIVDEAQDLTPMQWRMVTRRARGRSMTIVGDLAQRTSGPVIDWAGHLPDSLGDVARQDLTINYRSPAEINRLATKVLEELAPDLEPSQAIRSTGEEPVFVELGANPAVGLAQLVADERERLVDGERLAVIRLAPDAASTTEDGPDLAAVTMSPTEAKGLEFDVVVVVEPAEIVAAPRGLAQLYIALTRSTRRLVVAHCGPLPDCLAD